MIQSIEDIVTLWREVKAIKNRCETVTAEEMALVDKLVKWFNEETKNNRKANLKSFRVGTLLRGKGYIEKTESIYV